MKLRRVLAVGIVAGLAAVPSVVSLGDAPLASDKPLASSERSSSAVLNLAPPRDGEALGSWAARLALDPVSARIDAWAGAPLYFSDDPAGALYGGLTRLSRQLAAETAWHNLNAAKDGLLLGQEADYGFDKARMLDMTLKGLAETGKRVLDYSTIAALSNMEIRAGLGTDQKPAYSLLTVQPLYEDEAGRHNVFAQGGLGYRYDNHQGRTTANLGLGYRYLTPDEKWLYGVNAFYDHEFPYDHQRASVGVEAESSLYRVGANYYLGLSGWRNSRTYIQEKALNGADLELAGRLESFPQLEMAVRGSYWNYYDGETNVRELALRGEYAPVPALRFRLEGRDDNVSKPNIAATFGLKYTFGVPWKDQFKPMPPARLLSVKARRFDVVERQNIIKVQERVAGGPNMVAIYAKGTSYRMGCYDPDDYDPDPVPNDYTNNDRECQEDEKPEHDVDFKYNFEIGKYEVTWDEYMLCVDDGACIEPEEEFPFHGKGSRPVIWVSWDAVTTEYIPWLNAKTGRTYRLPSEAEWEYVARAGSNTVYPWGDDVTLAGTYANCNEAAIAACDDGFVYTTSPVGSFSANAWGVYDMIGNVEEWVQDTQDKLANGGYNNVPSDGSAYTATADDRVLRGGSWSSSGDDVVRSASRHYHNQKYGLQDIGFRLARTIP